MAERKRTKAEERAYAELQEVLHQLEGVRTDMVLAFERLKFDNMPFEWASVERLAPVRQRKVRIHTSYDADVAKFFRSMGDGYQARMNLVLRTYMLGILSRQVPSRKNEDWTGDEI